MGAVLAEAPITLSAVFLDLPIPALVACHVGVGLLLAGLAWRRRRDADAAIFAARGRDGRNRSIRRGGNAGRNDGRYAPPVQSIGRRTVSPESAGEISKRLRKSIVAGRELYGRSAGRASFRDILAHGSFQDEQAALAIITRRFSPALAPALRLALNDPDAAIRVQAATAAARIEDLFLAGLTQYTARVSEHPDDPECLLALARHLLGHAEAGLCPPERAAADLEQALSHLRQAVALAPLRRDGLAIAKVQLRRGDPREAARHLESLMEPLSADEILTYGEALHQISSWPKLGSFSRAPWRETIFPSSSAAWRRCGNSLGDRLMPVLPFKPKKTPSGAMADVCLIIEGAYPYVPGGVSSWVHDLIKARPELTFHLVALVAERAPRTLKYELPDNVLGIGRVYLQEMDRGSKARAASGNCSRTCTRPCGICSGPAVQDVAEISRLLSPHVGKAGRAALLNSPEAWDVLCRAYNREIPESSMLDYFWSWRALVGGLFAVMTVPLPRAAVYHTVSTGYAGLLATRAKLETERPTILTEHGIYTNERRMRS